MSTKFGFAGQCEVTWVGRVVRNSAPDIVHSGPPEKVPTYDLDLTVRMAVQLSLGSPALLPGRAGIRPLTVLAARWSASDVQAV